MLLQACAAVKAMRRIAVSRHGWHTRQTFLGDNMSLLLSWNRARSSSFPPLVQVRRFHAFALAFWIYVSIRWIPSELHASDAESRQQTHPDEHSALALLATCCLKPWGLPRQEVDHGFETMTSSSVPPEADWLHTQVQSAIKSNCRPPSGF